MFKKGDFHIHSIYSDGAHTPHEILMLSKRKNVDIIALTDHNSTCGMDDAIIAGKELDIKVIPGVELSTIYNNASVHVLGYFKDDSYKNELLMEVLKNIKKHKLSTTRNILGKHINFHTKNNRIYVETGIEILKFFGATVILAHPVLLNRNDFKNIIKMNFDGLEAKYFNNTNEDTEYFLNLADNRNLLYTAGSDFHSFNKFHKNHGMIGDVYLNEEEIINFLVNGNLI